MGWNDLLYFIYITTTNSLVHRHLIKKPVGKREVFHPDNKKLRILRLLKKNPRGLSRPQINQQLRITIQADDKLKELLEIMSAPHWISSSSVPYGKIEMTLYKITMDGKKTLKELDELLKSTTELGKLDVFDGFSGDD